MNAPSAPKPTPKPMEAVPQKTHETNAVEPDVEHITMPSAVTHQPPVEIEVGGPVIPNIPIVDTLNRDPPLSPTMVLVPSTSGPVPGSPASAGSSSSVQTAVDSDHTSDGTTASGFATTEAALATRNNVTGRWVDAMAKYGPTDWYNCTFTEDDPAAATTPRAITSASRQHLKKDSSNYFAAMLPDDCAGSYVPGGDDHTELTAERYRLPTLRAPFGRRPLPGIVGGKLRLGAFRFQHDDTGPTEPTGPLHGLRMHILCNFAMQCREAEHTAIAEGPMTVTKKHDEGDVIVPPLAPIDPLDLPVCRRCGRAQDFVMRTQHGRLFLETVLLPLSQSGTYADMVAHVNTCVIERVFAEGGMAMTSAAPTGPHWQDIKALPIYQDYQGALVLASHKRRVLGQLPMLTDAYGMLYGRKEPK